MAGVPLATAFVRILPEPGFGTALRTEAAAASPVITPKVNTAPAEGQIRGFLHDIGGKLIGALAIGEVLKTGLEVNSDYQKGLAQLQAGLKSTGNVAGLTADDMEKLADKISNYSGQNRATIVGTEQLLIAFRNVRDEAGKGNDIFTRATKAAADMAARMGGDASDQARKLGRALDDPIHGLTLLTRSGVTFTDGQKALIKSLVESGHILDAQKVILDQLEVKYGGSAKAVGDTLPGEINKAKNTFKELSGEIVGAVGPAFDLLLKGVVAVGKAFAGGVHFLVDHKNAVIAITAAYAALKWQAIAGAIAEFASNVPVLLGRVVAKAGEAATSLRALGGGSLIAGGLLAGAALGGVALLTYGLLTLGKGAQDAKKEVDALLSAYDLTSLQGLADAIKKLQENFRGAASDAGKSFIGAGGSDQERADLKAIQRLKDAQVNINELAKRYGVGTAAVEAFAKANKVDLSASQDDVNKQFDKLFKVSSNATQAMRDQAGAMHLLEVGNDAMNIQIGKTGQGLQNQIDLLSGVAKQSDLTSAKLLQNAKDALAAFQNETVNIQQLTAKGLDPAAIKALVDKGPEYVAAANKLSVADLKSFGGTYKQELAAQWARNAAVVGLGATAADRKAIDGIIAGQGAMDGATGKIAASITTAFLHEHPKAYTAAHDLYLVVQGEVDRLHGKTLQILLDDQASGNLGKLSTDLKYFTDQINGLPPGIAVGLQPLPAGVASPNYNAALPHAAGGLITGPGTGTSDSIHAMLSNGEYVVPEATVKQLGVGFFDSLPRYAAGGAVNLNDRWRLTISDAGLAQGLANYDAGVKNSMNLFSGASVGGGAQQWAPLVLQVLALLGQSASWLPNVLRQINTESGGNPHAINLWDSNAAVGQPSQGLLQTIPATFAGNAGPYIGLGIDNPLANVYAALHYALGRYGTLGILGQGHGYDNGGSLMPGWTMAYNGTGKPENVQTAAQAEHANRSAPLLHVEHWHGDQTDAQGLAQQLGAQQRAYAMARGI